MFRSLSLLVLTVSFALPASADAQVVITQSGAGGGLRAGSFGNSSSYLYWGANDPSRLLAYAQIQEELGLVDDQVKKLQQIRQDSYTKQREMYAELKDVAPEKRNEFLTELRETLAANTLKEIKSVLLPHQVTRLDQLTYQFKVKGQGAYALPGAKLAEAISLTDEQKQALKTKTAEMNRELAAEYQKLREKYQEDLLDDVLTKAQRTKLEQLMGKKYEPKPIQRQNFQILNQGKKPGGTEKPKED